MTDIRKLLDLFLYAGVGKEEYDMLQPNIHEKNRELLNVFSQIAAVMFFILFIASMLSQGFAAVNSKTYLLCGIEMLMILVCSRYILPKHPALVMLLVYIFEITLYVFSIRISMLHAENPAVSAVAFLLVSPLLFYDRPVRLSGLIAAVVAVFCGLVLRFKTPEVAATDIWNMITFGVVAVATTVFTMSIKIQTLAQSRRIQYLSRTDLMTGAKNRNYYEERMSVYPGLCESNLICVYADVNGLHEMNNRDGHDSGDRMLREVAETIQQYFGQDHTYRVGGDEFIAFRIDGQPEELSSEIDRLRSTLAEKGYQVSFGTAVREKSPGELNINELVREAETNMFAAKREFYRQSENNRRSR